MTPLLAAGLFDNPWVVLAFVVGGALLNWYSSRKAKALGQDPDADESPEPRRTPPPTEDPEWETTVRRLMGEDVPAPRPVAPPPPLPPAPPRIPHRTPPSPVLQPMPQPVFRREGSGSDSWTVPPPKPGSKVIRKSQVFRNAVNLASHGPARSSSGTAIDGSGPLMRSLRNPDMARKAYRMSLVFGPPKGLED